MPLPQSVEYIFVYDFMQLIDHILNRLASAHIHAHHSPFVSLAHSRVVAKMRNRKTESNEMNCWCCNKHAHDSNGFQCSKQLIFHPYDLYRFEIQMTNTTPHNVIAHKNWIHVRRKRRRNRVMNAAKVEKDSLAIPRPRHIVFRLFASQQIGKNCAEKERRRLVLLNDVWLRHTFCMNERLRKKGNLWNVRPNGVKRRETNEKQQQQTQAKSTTDGKISSGVDFSTIKQSFTSSKCNEKICLKTDWVRTSCDVDVESPHTYTDSIRVNVWSVCVFERKIYKNRSNNTKLITYFHLNEVRNLSGGGGGGSVIDGSSNNEKKNFLKITVKMCGNVCVCVSDVDLNYYYCYYDYLFLRIHSRICNRHIVSVWHSDDDEAKRSFVLLKKKNLSIFDGISKFSVVASQMAI